MGFAQPKPKQESESFAYEDVTPGRNEFAIAKKVYGLLTLSLFVTLFAGTLGTQIEFGSGMYWASLLMPFPLLFAISAAKTTGAGILALGAFSFFEGIGMGAAYTFIAAAGHADAWWTAVGITLSTFLGLTAYAWTTRKDFGKWRGALFVALLGMLFLSLLGMFLPMPGPVGLAISFVGVFLFAAYILHDTSEVIHRVPEGSAALAACGLYLDILNLFWYVFRILAAFDDD